MFDHDLYEKLKLKYNIIVYDIVHIIEDKAPANHSNIFTIYYKDDTMDYFTSGNLLQDEIKEILEKVILNKIIKLRKQKINKIVKLYK